MPFRRETTPTLITDLTRFPTLIRAGWRSLVGLTFQHKADRKSFADAFNERVAKLFKTYEGGAAFLTISQTWVHFRRSYLRRGIGPYSGSTIFIFVRINGATPLTSLFVGWYRDPTARSFPVRLAQIALRVLRSVKQECCEDGNSKRGPSRARAT